jgi:hypothetical protein
LAGNNGVGGAGLPGIFLINCKEYWVLFLFYSDMPLYWEQCCTVITSTWSQPASGKKKQQCRTFFVLIIIQEREATKQIGLG